MEKIIDKIKNNKIEAIFISVIIIIFILLTLDFSPSEKQEESKPTKTKETEKTEEKLIVDIKGAVKNPGVFEMQSDNRVIDVINKAGGLTNNADTSMINLSKKIKDEMVITIYTKEEMKETEKECPPCECPEVNNACVSENEAEEKETKTEEKTNNSSQNIVNGKVNINSATAEELQTLDGIGETKAASIIGYRETNGKFKSIEEIKNVSGIGDSTFEKIKNNITV